LGAASSREQDVKIGAFKRKMVDYIAAANWPQHMEDAQSGSD
jgi:hypothetical protein